MKEIYVRDELHNTCLCSTPKMYTDAFNKTCLELGISGTYDSSNSVPLIYLRDYLYRKLYDDLKDVKTLLFVSVEFVNLNVVKIIYEGKNE